MRTLSDEDLDAIAQRVALLFSLQQPSSTQQIPNEFLPSGEALQYLRRYRNIAALGHALRKGVFKSGTEAIKQGGDWMINPAAHLARVQREQQKNKVC
jgi:hypothetical protein